MTARQVPESGNGAVLNGAVTNGSGGPAAALLRPFVHAWNCRELIRAIVWRDLSQRFRQSYFGWFWAVATPLLLLTVYTVMFSHVIRVSEQAEGPLVPYALSIFVGIVVFHLFVELLHRAPMLLPEHAQFIKKSIFPSEVLAWTALLRALVYAGIGLVVFFVFELALAGRIPATALLFPLLLVPFCLFLLGMIWALAALGAFTRDVAFFTATLTPALFFSSPVLFVSSELPANLRLLVYLNPVSPYIEIARDLLLLGQLPHADTCLVALAVALVVFYGGYGFFMRFRRVVVDVL